VQKIKEEAGLGNVEPGGEPVQPGDAPDFSGMTPEEWLQIRKQMFGE